MHNAPFSLFPPPHFLPAQAPPFIMNSNKSAADSWRTTEAGARLAFSGQNFLSPVVSKEEDFFAELNRRLTLSDSTKPSQVSKVVGGSPQSILGGIGSWSGRSSNQSPVHGPSPPHTPYKNDDYDADGLIYAAAGQVEEQLKFYSEYPLKPSVNGAMSEQNHNLNAEYLKDSFLAQQNYLAAARRAYNAALIYEHRLQILANSARYTKPSTQSTRITLQQQHPRLCSKASIQPAIPYRRESAGTGVFLPRNYSTNSVAPPRKREVTTSAMVPAKVLQALNMSLEEMNCPTKPRYNAYAASTNLKNLDELMVRRSVFLAQQQQRVAIATDLEMCLPKEWSY